MITDIEIGERVAARDILSYIERVCFSERFSQYRQDHDSNDQRDLIIKYIKEKYLD